MNAACRVRPMLYRSTRPHHQRDALLSLGVQADRIYVDHGLTGTNREQPRLREALAACRAGDTLVVTKVDPLTSAAQVGEDRYIGAAPAISS